MTVNDFVQTRLGGHEKSRTLQPGNFSAFYTGRPRHWSTPLLRTWLRTGSNLLGTTKKVAVNQGQLGSCRDH